MHRGKNPMATIGKKPPRKKTPKGDAKTIENGKAGSRHNSDHGKPKKKSRAKRSRVTGK